MWFNPEQQDAFSKAIEVILVIMVAVVVASVVASTPGFGREPDPVATRGE